MARGTKVAPQTRETLRQHAMSLRSYLENPIASYFPIAEFLDVGLPRMLPEFVLRVVEDDVLGGREGMTIPDEWRIYLPERVYRGALDRRGRDRFTCAHELGHLLLHHGISLDRLTPRFLFDTALHPNTEDSEWQADSFAAEFLMPVDVVRRYAMSGARLAEACGVPLQAAVWRLKILRMEGLLK